MYISLSLYIYIYTYIHIYYILTRTPSDGAIQRALTAKPCCCLASGPSIATHAAMSDWAVSNSAGLSRSNPAMPISKVDSGRLQRAEKQRREDTGSGVARSVWDPGSPIREAWPERVRERRGGAHSQSETGSESVLFSGGCSRTVLSRSLLRSSFRNPLRTRSQSIGQLPSKHPEPGRAHGVRGSVRSSRKARGSEERPRRR